MLLLVSLEKLIFQNFFRLKLFLDRERQLIIASYTQVSPRFVNNFSRKSQVQHPSGVWNAICPSGVKLFYNRCFNSIFSAIFVNIVIKQSMMLKLKIVLLNKTVLNSSCRLSALMSVWRQEVMMTNFTIIRYSEQKYFHWVALSE